MVRWFNDNDENTEVNDDLPWYRDYYKDGTRKGRTVHVIECYTSPKGLLLLTTEYKAFVFKRDKWAAFIQAALLEWVNDSTLPNCLIMGYGSDRKPLFGIDEDIQNTYWVAEENSYKRKSNTGDSTKPAHSSNPLLPPQSGYAVQAPASTSTKGKSTKQ